MGQFIFFFKKSLVFLFLSSILISCHSGSRNEPNDLCEETFSIPPIETDSPHFSTMLQCQGGIYQSDPALTQYVREVGLHLAQVSHAPNIPYQFEIVHNGTANAWALSEGKIAIHRGLFSLLNNEAELAAVLAREIVFSSRNESSSQGLNTENGIKGRLVTIENPIFSNSIYGDSILLNLNRTEEELLSADIDAIEMMTLAGYDPHALEELSERLFDLQKEKNMISEDGYLSAQPISKKRLDSISKLITKQKKGLIAEKRYQKKTKLLTSFKEAYDDLDTALDALANGNYRLAENLSEEGIKALSDEGRFHYIKAVTAIYQGRYQKALSQLNLAFETDDTYFDYYLQRGIIESALGFYEKSEKDLKKSISLCNTAEAHYLLGDLLYEQRQVKEAITHFKIASEVDSAVMLLAQEQLTRLDIPKNPSKYLHVNACIDKRGFLSLALVNKSSIPVRDVMVSIDTTDVPNITIPRKVLRFSETTPEGKSQLQHTGVGPFENMEQLEVSLKVQILSASPVRIE